MRLGRIAIGSVVSAALLAGSVVPAMARDHGWGGPGGWGRDRGWHRHRDGFGFGDAVGVAALIGAVAIVASSMSKDKQARDGDRDRGYDDPRARDGSNDDWSDGSSSSGSSSSGREQTSDRGYSDTSRVGDESAAVDACAVAAREEASSKGGYAEIRDIGEARAVDGGWDVDGRVEQRTAYREQAGNVRRFTCSVRDGRVAEVYLSRDVAA
jgi:hypothetical protein